MDKAELFQQVKSRRRSDRSLLQRQVYEFVLLNAPSVGNGNFATVSSADIGVLFQITDELFFGGSVSRYFESNFNKPLKFRLSTRMTTCGGMTTMQKFPDAPLRETEFEIAIATTPLFGTFKYQSQAKVGGLKCSDRLEALQRILEHELIHLVELLVWGDSNCQGNQYKRLVKSHFGHVESNHQLLTPSDVARKQLGIACGDYVTFKIEGKQRRGFVNRITKRATVLVPDKAGTRYCDGKCYAKYYVPLNRLKRA
jgi:hypothetical protein